jgi:hypothetical protein
MWLYERMIDSQRNSVSDNRDNYANDKIFHYISQSLSCLYLTVAGDSCPRLT